MSYFSSSYLILPVLLKMGTSGGLRMECGMGAASTAKVAHSYEANLCPVQVRAHVGLRIRQLGLPHAGCLVSNSECPEKKWKVPISSDTDTEDDTASLCHVLFISQRAYIQGEGTEEPLLCRRPVREFGGLVKPPLCVHHQENRHFLRSDLAFIISPGNVHPNLVK